MAAIYRDESRLSKACAAGKCRQVARLSARSCSIFAVRARNVPIGKIQRPAERPQVIRNQRNIWETAEAKRPGHEVPKIRDGPRFPSSTLAIPPAPKSKENAMIKSALVVTAAAFAALAAIVPAAYAITPCF